jgi:hypothetical protein
MKQYINSSQLKELLPDQFRRLCKLIGNNYYSQDTDEQIINSFKKEYLTMYLSILEQTNIGKIIEILDDKYEVEISKDVFTSKECWNVSLFHKEEFIFYKEFIKEELVDALWEAVKEII